LPPIAGGASLPFAAPRGAKADELVYVPQEASQSSALHGEAVSIAGTREAIREFPP